MQNRLWNDLPSLVADKPDVLEVTSQYTARLLPWTLANRDVTFFHHHSTFELGVCYSGCGKHYTPDGVSDIDCGDALLLFPGQKHIASGSTSDETKCIFVYIDYEKLFQESGLSGCRIITECLSRKFTLYNVIKQAEYPEINAAIKRIIEAYQTFDSSRTMMLGIRFLEMLMMLAETNGPEREISLNNAKEMDRFKAAAKEIDSKLNEGRQISIDELASICFMSVSNFRKAFKQVYGMAPHDYIIEKAISKAQCLLLSTEKSMLEICMDTGFQSVSSFNRNFKALSGETPEGYRAIHK